MPGKSLKTLNLRFAKADSIFANDLFDEYGNVIVEANNPLPRSLIRHLLKENKEYLYYYTEKDGQPKEEKKLIDEGLKLEISESIKAVLDEAREIFDYSSGSGINREKINRSRKLVNEVLSEIDTNSDGVFNPFTKFTEMDEYDYNHSTNVSILGALVASKLEFNRETRSAMGLGGLFHDIGKTSVSKEILNKAGKLDDEEFDLIKNHTHIGYKFIENSPFINDIEKQIVLLHHERPDGNGYPYGVDYSHYMNKIPREVRLITLCDIYSALISDRPYGKSMERNNILRFMLNMVHAPYKTYSHILPSDFRDFIRVLDVSVVRGNFFIGPGDIVRISTGEIAIVSEMNKLYPLNPVVRVVADKNKKPLKRVVQVDMLNDFSSYISNVFDKKEKKDKSNE